MLWGAGGGEHTYICIIFSSSMEYDECFSKLQMHPTHWVGIGWGLRFCFSKKLSGDLETDGEPQVE